VSFELERGGCLAIMGPSGAGKSLLLRAITDLDPNSGDVTLAGHARHTMTGPQWRRRVGYVPAESGWWADVVGDHMSDADAAGALAGRLALPPEVLDWPVARLSTGEKQRLALIRAVVLRPDVLLLDEPTGSLDAEGRAAVEALLGELRDGGVSLVLITHDKDQAERLADRVLAMRDGQLTDADSRP